MLFQPVLGSGRQQGLPARGDSHRNANVDTNCRRDADSDRDSNAHADSRCDADSVRDPDSHAGQLLRRGRLLQEKL